MTTTDLDLDECRKLYEQATQPAPWVSVVQDGNATVVDAHGMWVADCGSAPDDAAFIAASRQLVPALVAEVRHLRAKLTELESDDAIAAYAYEATIDDNLPHYSIGTGTDVHGEDDRANYHERVEYAGEELREMRRDVMRMHDEREEARQLVIAYVNASHVRDADCSAGDHDNCEGWRDAYRELHAAPAHWKEQP